MSSSSVKDDPAPECQSGLEAEGDRSASLTTPPPCPEEEAEANVSWSSIVITAETVAPEKDADKLEEGVETTANESDGER